jgi:hypothetical protein
MVMRKSGASRVIIPPALTKLRAARTGSYFALDFLHSPAKDREGPQPTPTLTSPFKSAPTPPSVRRSWNLRCRDGMCCALCSAYLGSYCQVGKGTSPTSARTFARISSRISSIRAVQTELSNWSVSSMAYVNSVAAKSAIAIRTMC